MTSMYKFIDQDLHVRVNLDVHRHPVVCVLSVLFLLLKDDHTAERIRDYQTKHKLLQVVQDVFSATKTSDEIQAADDYCGGAIEVLAQLANKTELYDHLFHFIHLLRQPDAFNIKGQIKFHFDPIEAEHRLENQKEKQIAIRMYLFPLPNCTWEGIPEEIWVPQLKDKIFHQEVPDFLRRYYE